MYSNNFQEEEEQRQRDADEERQREEYEQQRLREEAEAEAQRAMIDQEAYNEPNEDDAVPDEHNTDPNANLYNEDQ